MFSSPSSGGSNRKRRTNNNNKNRHPLSARRDVPTHLVTKWTKFRLAVVTLATIILSFTSFFPIFLLERQQPDAESFQAPVSLHKLLTKSVELEQEYKAKGLKLWNRAKGALDNVKLPESSKHHDNDQDTNSASETNQNNHLISRHNNKGNGKPKSKKSKQRPKQKHEDVTPNTNNNNNNNDHNSLARGVSGLPMDKTPALIGAQRGHIECDVNVDDVVYWNSPQGNRDVSFKSPFATPEGRYLTFEPDPGGWNNIRMSMEIIFVLAAATGRTLVLPPKAPFYLLGIGSKNARSFGNFFPLENEEFKKRVNVITMEEFLEREGSTFLELSATQKDKLMPVAEMCLHKPDSEISCELLYTHLRKKGFQPPLQSAQDCLAFDLDVFHGNTPSSEVSDHVKRFCGTKRTVHYYDDTLHDPKLIHWDASTEVHRLLNHFYAFMLFTDPVIDNYYKRFVRDFLHYKDEIYCAAGKIIHALNAENKPWSSLHVRRGDLQYKKVKIPAEEWYENTKEVWEPNEILYIATDERNKTFFDPIKQHHELRFLDDYWDAAKLGDIDSNQFGMIDTIVASHGRAFAGTWFSTFTGYINRMRGYLGHSMKYSWYSWLPRKDAMQQYKYPQGNYGAREWPIGWIAIDGDEIIEHEGNLDAGSIVSSVDLREKVDLKVSDLTPDSGFDDKPIQRGVAGLPMAKTPALAGAHRGHIECDVNVDSLAYWNDPQGKRDQDFVSPFKNTGKEKYITFTSDRGGWNNVRMSMEIIFVIAATTGRTLVLPPREPLYRLRADTKNIHRGFADFFPLQTAEFQKRVKIISMEEFIKREGGPDGQVPIPESMREDVENSAEHCDKRKGSKADCSHIAEFLAQVGYVPDARAQDYCVVFDKEAFEGKPLTTESQESIQKFCGTRNQTIWGPEFNEKPLIHFRAGEKRWRLLTHFYVFIHFTDPSIDNYYKRFVRDFLHYHDSIYCAAGKIVKAIQAEGANHGFPRNEEDGSGGFSAMHVRRGELQYKKVKIPAEEWYENTKEVWQRNEIIYIATDERNKTFFEPIAEHHTVRFLDDYWDLAQLGDVDPNHFGMIDTIVASRARAFAGTWFSTFSGYINRLRGYHGLSMKDSWYSFLDRKTRMHTWDDVDTFAFAYEWPTGWVGIDGDVIPSKEKF